jgi:hypothetical protein
LKITCKWHMARLIAGEIIIVINLKIRSTNFL